MQRQMLSREDETSSEDVPVRREDQEKINKFSRLHNREAAYELELKQKQKEKEDLEEISSELEMIELEGDENVPYKIGDCFFTLPVSEAQELISKSTDRIDQNVTKLESSLGRVRDEMQELKVALYSRFGRSINLEI